MSITAHLERTMGRMNGQYEKTREREGRQKIEEALRDPIAKASKGERCSEIFDGTYTIENKPKGTHRTFKIGMVRNPGSGIAGQRVVALLAGPDNNSDYSPFAFLDDEGIKVWKRKRGTPGRPSLFDLYAAILWSLCRDDDDAEAWREKGAELLIEGRCMVCGRKLTDPDSIRTGIGPVCLSKGGAA